MKIEIEKLTRDDRERDNDCRGKAPDDRQWQREGQDGHRRVEEMRLKCWEI